MFLLFALPCSAELIYSPITHEALYEYQGVINEDTVFKSDDFLCFKSDTPGKHCRQLNLFHPMDYTNNLPLDGFDYWAWERGYNIPNKPYKIYTFLVKRREQFVWVPYDIDYISNLMGN